MRADESDSGVAVFVESSEGEDFPLGTAEGGAGVTIECGRVVDARGNSVDASAPLVLALARGAARGDVLTLVGE